MRQYLLAIVACLTCTALSAAAPPATGLRAGAATSNITPSLGADIVGGFVPFPATNVHDDLHARCLVLDDGQTKLALVVLDLLGIDYCVSNEARKLIAEEAGIPPSNVLISAVHTHSAASALGASIAAVGGTLYGMAYTIDPYMGIRIGWWAFISAVVGGIGNIRGAMLGGFILGFVEIFTPVFLPASTYRDFVAFSLLLVLLIFKPTGLLGRPMVQKV